MKLNNTTLIILAVLGFMFLKKRNQTHALNPGSGLGSGADQY